jgi:hypothetical protein
MTTAAMISVTFLTTTTLKDGPSTMTTLMTLMVAALAGGGAGVEPAAHRLLPARQALRRLLHGEALWAAIFPLRISVFDEVPRLTSTVAPRF